MGDFRMVIEASGGHGCNRTAKEGGEFYGCGQETCPDCLFARFVSEMQRAGMRPFVAEFHHWPSSMNKHLASAGGDENSKCQRCGRSVTDSEPCRTYTEDREVVDDYSERGVKHPTGSFRRATGVRVKGSF